MRRELEQRSASTAVLVAAAAAVLLVALAARPTAACSSFVVDCWTDFAVVTARTLDFSSDLTEYTSAWGPPACLPAACCAARDGRCAELSGGQRRQAVNTWRMPGSKQPSQAPTIHAAPPPPVQTSPCSPRPCPSRACPSKRELPRQTGRLPTRLSHPPWALGWTWTAPPPHGTASTTPVWRWASCGNRM